MGMRNTIYEFMWVNSETNRCTKTVVHVESTVLCDGLKNKYLSIPDPDLNLMKPNYHTCSLEIEHSD
jgi:hypothetical protein